ncbi:MAG: hypothetical protein ABW321_15125 [Polyangiales bacterium]
MSEITLATLVGYDATLLRQLTAAERERIAWFALAVLLATMLVAAPFVYAAWLALQSYVAAAGVGVGGLGMLLAIVRLSVAGGGPHAAERLAQQGSYAGPLRVLGLVGVLAAQPAQLLVARDEIRPAIERRRQELLARYDELTHSLPAQTPAAAGPAASASAPLRERAELTAPPQAASSVDAGAGSGRLGGGRSPDAELLRGESPRVAVVHPSAGGHMLAAASREAYRARLARCELVALRLGAVWGAPERAVRYSLAFLGLVLLPCLAARAMAGRALRRYELRRSRGAHVQLARDAESTAHALVALLSPYTSYAPRDPARAPLRTPWRAPAPRAARERGAS